MKSVTILVPAYNEEAVLYQLYDRLKEVINGIPLYHFEILFVNDGSKDQTLSIIKKMRESDDRISYVNLSRNFGKEIGMIAGLDHAKGDAVIIIDADLQDPPELIPEMIKYWEMGYDDVFAKRRSRSGESWLKKWTSSAFYKVLQKVTRIPIQENTGDFRLLDRRCVEALKQIREAQRYTKGMFSWIGYNKKEILFDRDPRAAGETKWNYSKLIDLAIEGITSFTTTPLRISAMFGCIISLFAFIYIIWIIGKTLLFGEPVAGYPSLMTVILFLGGIQLISLGIIGEYLGRIFNETKNRPLYFVDEYNNEKVLNQNSNENRSIRSSIKQEKKMKNKKEMVSYLVFGVLTTAVNIISFWLFDKWLDMDYKLATTIAWILSVLFAFVTNKLYVFNSKKIEARSVFKELRSFLFFRLLSYLLDLVTMIILVEFLKVDSLIAKIIANVFVVVFNYFASKYVIFKTANE